MNTKVYNILRALFVAGNAVSLVLLFVPSVRVGPRRGAQLMSGFDVMNALAQGGNLAWFLFTLLLFVVAPILSIVLAIARPKRWVFIGGAGVAAFILLIDLFQGSNPNVRPVEEVQILGYAITLLMMVGFVIKPPQPAAA